MQTIIYMLISALLVHGRLLTWPDDIGTGVAAFWGLYAAFFLYRYLTYLRALPPHPKPSLVGKRAGSVINLLARKFMLPTTLGLPGLAGSAVDRKIQENRRQDHSREIRRIRVFFLVSLVLAGLWTVGLGYYAYRLSGTAP